MPLRQSYVMGMAEPEQRGGVAGLSQLPAQLTAGVAPIPAGFVFDHVSMELPIGIAAPLQCAVSAVFLALFHDKRPPHESPSIAEPGDLEPSSVGVVLPTA
ncbi:MAG TPA: hypothetical protein VK821_08615 [Dehalococcoidia bacterium]|nr:hypothetical protein [Dehalococcoidia bacterium]